MPRIEEVVIDRLVHGGQGIGTTAAGKKIFVWNALPGETVAARVIKRKRNYDEAIAEQILVASPDRVEPRETNYLATSPWQIMNVGTENTVKHQIVQDVMAHEKVSLPQDVPAIITAGDDWHYRNKMEYSFWGDDQGLHLALHQRGSAYKQILTSSALAMPAIDVAAQAICVELERVGMRAGQLKTVVIRANLAGKAVASLFVKNKDFPAFTLGVEVQGIRVYYSDPKSPASVKTELLHEAGDVTLQDTLLGKSFTYDVDSFFQVNVPVFEKALSSIRDHMAAPVLVDLYAGVGSIGLSVASKAATLVELDVATAEMAAVNAAAGTLSGEVVITSAEASLDYITADTPLIVDPPRAGLHPKVTDRICETPPPKLAYMSCNPATQARDLARLQTVYNITHFEVYNFFPHTPHIETVAILVRR